MKWLSGVFIALLLNGCAKEPLYQEQLFTFGTLVNISIWGEDEAVARHAVDELAHDFDVMHRDWHAWHPGPLVSLNEQLLARQEAVVPPELLPLMQQSLALYQASGGLFDPAIGRLLQLWGFEADVPPAGPPPADAAVQALLARRPTLGDVELHDNVVRSSNPNIWLDFGAVAKGYGVDKAVDRLRALGIRNAIVVAGGDLKVVGARGDRPWRIGVRHPRGSDILASLNASSGECILTSGDYERYYEFEGQRYHHVLDPRSGYPARGAVSATVIHNSAATADAAATALLVAGPQQWYATARAMGIKYVMLVDQAGTVHMNPAMARRIHFEVDPLPRIELSDEL
ncbi:MAG: hypothetical protein A2V90_03275 [Gammaproteobacteria bacterium RBG_16_57_12]|nr:MAG: hypothetical protein A2V90_03275 [Gammaproteobacteria bacterium RBG_16_57_12]